MAKTSETAPETSGVPATRQDVAAALQVGRPSFLPTTEGPVHGFEMMRAKDMTVPRLSLAQSTTPQIKKANEKYVPGLEEGMFFNSVTGEIYGTKVLVIPLFFFRSRIFFKDLKEGGGVLCQAPGPDGMKCQLNAGGPCLHDTWGAKGEPPECNEFMNYPCIMPSNGNDLICVSLKSTGLKASKDWNTLMRIRKSDMFAGIYSIESKPARNKAGLDYFAYKIDNAGWVEDEKLWRFCGDQYDSVYQGIAAGTIVVEQEGLREEQAVNEM